MKTYKRNELKDIFQKELNNIKVTNKLKNKTLSNIPKQTNVSIYRLKNCAAVLLVSCICLSLYLNQNSFFYKKSITLESVPQDSNLKIEESIPQTTSVEETKMRTYSSEDYQPKSTPIESYKETITQNTAIEYGLGNVMQDTAQISENSSIITENLENEKILNQIKIGDTVQKLLQYYPDLEKEENTYQLIHQNNVTIYHIENGIITDISQTSSN